jgi:cyanophycinase
VKKAQTQARLRVRGKWQLLVVLAIGLLLAPQVIPAQEDAALTADWPMELKIRGALVLSGGGELPDAALTRFYQLAGGENARLAVIPVSRSSAERAMDEAMVKALKDKGAASVKLYDFAALAKASDNGTTVPLQSISGVWLCGDGAPRRALEEVGLKEILAGVIERGGVVGAHAAGASAITGVTITTGNPQARVGSGLDLLPGTVIDTRFTEEKRQNRLMGVIASHPGLLGIGIDEKTAMVLEGRQIRAVGEGAVTLMVPGSPYHPARIHAIKAAPAEVEPAAGQRVQEQRAQSQQGQGQRQRGQEQRVRGQRGQRQQQAQGQQGQGQRQRGQRSRGEWADWTAWRRQAVNRTLTQFPWLDPRPPNVESGTLIIVGGGGMPEGLRERFIELAGGPEELIVCIPCSEADNASGESMTRGFVSAGAKNVTWIHTKDRNKADNDKEILEKLKNAKGIWFGGGRQWNLVDSWQGTKAHELILDVLKRGGVVGGSSAGASIQSEYLPRGDPRGNTNIIAPGYERGLGLLTGVAVDQHFIRRNRLANMTELMAKHPSLLGIGIDEATAIIVQGSIAEVVGRSKVLIYDRLTRSFTPGEKDYLELEAGQFFDLKERKIIDPELR